MSTMTALNSDSPEARVLAYFEKELDEERLFIKSRHVAAELDLSAKKIGQTLRLLASGTPQFDIKPWGGSSDGTTWLVERS